MNHARAALAIAALLSGSRTVQAEPCAPRAELGGDAVAVAQVRDELRRLGVETGPSSPGCRAVRAQVELDREGGIDVAIVDGSRRSEGRVVGHPSMAAAWIDTWLRDDVDGLGPLVTERAHRVATAGGTSTAAPGEPRDATTTPRPLLERFAVDGAYERTWTEDDASATGVRGGVCVRMRWLCVGLTAHYAREHERTIKLTAMRRRDASLLATASAPIRIGRLSIGPELGVGLGRRTTARVEGCVKTPECDPTDPACVPKPPCDSDPGGKIYVGDNLDVATFTPRVAVALRVAVPLFEYVWLEGLAELMLAPLGHAQSFTPQNGTADTPASELALPGEPDRSFQLGVGLRIGAP